MSRYELVVDERGGGEHRTVREGRAVVVVVTARVRRGRRLIEAVSHRALQVRGEPANSGRSGRGSPEIERDLRRDALLRREQTLPDLVGRGGKESRIRAEMPAELREASLEADRGLRFFELTVQPPDFREPDAMDFLGRHIEGRVETNEPLIVGLSSGVLSEADRRGRLRRILARAIGSQRN